MAGNSQIIDTVVDKSAFDQVESLTELLDALDIKFTQATQNANALNAALGGSKNFADYDKKANAAAIGQAKLNKELANAAIAEQRLQRETLQLEAAQRRQTDALNRQTDAQERANKRATEASRPFTELTNKLRDLDRAAQDAGATFGTSSEQYREAAAAANEVRVQVQGINRPLGNFRDNVGNYAGGIMQVVETAWSGIRRLAQILPNFGVGTFFLLAGEGVMKLVQSLGILDGVLTETEQKQKALNAAFQDASYAKAIEDTEKLRVNIERAKQGFIDKDRVIDEYNESIGKVAGSVSTLDQAEQGLVKHGQAFIQMTLLKAAASLALQNAAKDRLEAEQKIQELDAKSAESQADLEKFRAVPISKFASKGDRDQQLQAIKNATDYEIRQNERGKKTIEDRLDKNLKNSLQVITKFYQQVDALRNGGGQTGRRLEGADDGTGGGEGVSGIAQARTDLENSRLEGQKIALQKIIDNEKNSFDKRIKATIDFGKVQQQIEKNNLDLQLTQKGLNDVQIENLNQDYKNQYDSTESETTKNVQHLRDEQFNALKTYYDNAIAETKSREKSISDNQKNTYGERIEAVQKYANEATKLVNTASDKEVNQVGDNKEKIIAIRKEQKKQLEDIQTTVNSDLEKIEKDYENELRKQLEDILKLDKAIADQAISIAQNQSDEEIAILQKQRDKEAILIEESYKKNKLTKQQYNDALLKLDDQYNVDRLGQMAYAEQQALAILQVREDSDVKAAIAKNATPEQVEAIRNNSGVKQQQQKVNTAYLNLGNAVKKQNEDTTGIDERTAQSQREQAIEAIQDATQLQADGSKLLQSEYQHEIELLQQKSELIQQNAQNEINAVNNSIASAQTKQNQINVINAQAAQQQQAIQNQEKKIKEKQAKTDRELAIAQIIEQTAVGEIKAVGQAGIFGIPFTAIIAALGAAQLAVVLATPLPTFATGTDSHPGGWGIWGEAGVEKAIEPSGKTYYSKGPTLQKMPKGTRIIPNNELMGLASPGVTAFVDMSGSNEKGFDKVVNAIKGQKIPKQRRPVIHVHTNGHYLTR